MKLPRIVRTSRPTAFIAGLLIATTGLAAERVAINVRPVRWQTLPAEVTRVFVGPDQRAWYVLGDATEAELDVAALKAQIAAEFALPAPQLCGVRPALFEKSGRAWFVTDNGAHLLGYDGKTWIERPAKADRPFCGNCPNHPPVLSEAVNLALGADVFFPDRGGVHRFDGRQWSYQEMGTAPPPVQPKHARFPWYTAPQLLVEPDERGVVALTWTNTVGVWHFRDGRWTQRESPPEMTDKPGQGVAAFTADGTLHLFRSQYAVVTPRATLAFAAATTPAAPVPVKEPRAEFAVLLARLGDTQFAVREQASRDLAKLGRTARAPAEVALGTEHDPEVRMRLQEFLAGLGEEPPPPPQPVTLADYKLQKYVRAWNVGAHDFYLAGNNVLPPKGRAFVAGTIIVSGTNAPVFLTPEQFPLLLAQDRRHLGRFPVGAGHREWWSGVDAAGPVLMDLAQRQIVDRGPDDEYVTVQAVRADGAVFLGHEKGAGPLGLYQPGQPEDRRMVTPRYVDLDWPSFCVATDGAIWAHVNGAGLQRFDGKTWAEIPGLARGTTAKILIPTHHGGVFLQTLDDEYVLITTNEVRRGSSLSQLIAEQRTDFAAAFAPGFSYEWRELELCLGADKAGNVWLLQGNRLRVLIGSQWTDPVVVTGTNRTVGLPEQTGLIAVGDGSVIHLTDHSWQKSFLGRVEENAAVCRASTNTYLRYGAFDAPVNREPNGAVWLMGRLPNSGFMPSPSGVAAYRITEHGFSKPYQDLGLPLVADAAGNVWLSPFVGPLTNQVTICHNGQMTGRFPFSSVTDSQFVSDRSGSVYVWRHDGLHHYMADNPDGPTTYREQEHFQVESPERTINSLNDILRVTYSSYGYIVAGVQSRATVAKHRLYLIPITPEKRP